MALLLCCPTWAWGKVTLQERKVFIIRLIWNNQTTLALPCTKAIETTAKLNSKHQQALANLGIKQQLIKNRQFIIVGFYKLQTYCSA